MTAIDGRAPGASDLTPSTFGAYRLLLEVGSGGMAAVHAATGPQGELVALKIPHDYLLEERPSQHLLEEARQGRLLDHPNLVCGHAMVQHGGRVGLVMPYVDGLPLGILRRRANDSRMRLSVPVVLRMVLDVLEGLAAAHRATDRHGRSLHLVHRDVTPSNLLVGADGRTRLIDFGVARSLARRTATEPGLLKGKVPYLPPETIEDGRCDARSDLYQLAVVLWEGLCWRSLFSGDSWATLEAILHGPIPSVSAIMPELAPLDAVLERALARDPEARYDSAEDMAEALTEAARRVGGVADHARVACMVDSLAFEVLEHRRTVIAHRQAVTERHDSVPPSRSGMRTRPTASRAPAPLREPPSSAVVAVVTPATLRLWAATHAFVRATWRVAQPATLRLARALLVTDRRATELASAWARRAMHVVRGAWSRLVERGVASAEHGWARLPRSVRHGLWMTYARARRVARTAESRARDARRRLRRWRLGR